MNIVLGREVRKWIYASALAAVPLLVFYGVIDENAAPLWIAMIGSILAPTLALANLSPDLPTAGEACDGGAPIDGAVTLDIEGS